MVLLTWLSENRGNGTTQLSENRGNGTPQLSENRGKDTLQSRGKWKQASHNKQ